MTKAMTKSLFILLLSSLFFAVFFQVLYHFDNKYTTRPPYGKDGHLEIQEEDLSRKPPLYLIDGWELYPGLWSPEQLDSQAPLPYITYIGQYATYPDSRWPSASQEEPTALYRLSLSYSGKPTIGMLSFSEIFDQYTVWVNGKPAASGQYSGSVSFPLTEEGAELLILVRGGSHYYNGIYYPPALGTQETVTGTETIRNFVYGLALAAAFTLALFSLSLWREKETPIYRNFGFLCLSFCMYISYHFVHLFHLPFEEVWYLIEDLAFYCLVFFVVEITALAAGLAQGRRFRRYVKPAVLLLPALCFLLSLLIPWNHDLIPVHGALQNLYRIFVCIWLILAAVRSVLQRSGESVYVLSGNAVFGAGLFINLFFSNLYEPIYTLWQTEWCAFFLILLFGAMMTARNRRILADNRAFTKNLELMVEERTTELSMVLEERKQFFSDIAHDLKAPLSSTITFIEAIRRNSVGLDEDLRRSLGEVEKKQAEMSKRVQSLNTLSRLDQIASEKEPISVNSLMSELNSIYPVSYTHLRRCSRTVAGLRFGTQGGAFPPPLWNT